ncbi:hypothetical protein CAPTEDRAFT_168598 [Capitella teleta]|uniref:L-fucokinase domain-containing protein n=1 Tax=Capitella teleta TaxID=283909 RepID=R7T3J1_CAPTE|nr:hypothetical protein CAPTEDRAFT_168598 [Capitella teleta]|eukprot:ELT87342.1 hypothetical protein CAPTEDRAFT_168598 [Capitella teleta]
MSPSFKWDAIVLTCQDKEGAKTFNEELKYHQQSGVIAKETLILTVEDPKSSVGSGGATLNALLVVAEHLSALQGFTVVNGDVLNGAHILILHMGRHFPCDPCGRAFTILPLERCSPSNQSTNLVSNFDVLLDAVTHKLARDSPPGIWVCSTDMLLNIPDVVVAPPNWNERSVCALAVPANSTYAQSHGVFCIGDDGFVKDIVYRGSESEVASCALPNGSVPMVAGVVFFGHQVAERLLTFHVVPPLDSCTYIGLDSGAKPIQLSIFFDMMLAMCTGLTEETFVSHRVSNVDVNDESLADISTVESARRRIWKDLHPFRVTPWLIEEGSHSYMNALPQQHHSHMTHCPIASCDTFKSKFHHHSFLVSSASVSSRCVFINSIAEERVSVGSGAVVCHSHLPPDSCIGERSFVSGFLPQGAEPLHLEADLSLNVFSINLSNFQSEFFRVFAIWGTTDDLQKPFSHSDATYCGLSWKSYLDKSGIKSTDLWGDMVGNYKCCMMSAKLFPVFHPKMSVGLRESLFLVNFDPALLETYALWRLSCRVSLNDILSSINVSEEFKHRRQLFYAIGKMQIRDVLMRQRDVGLGSLYAQAAVEGFSHQLLDTLDSVALESSSPGITARTLANIADVLGAMSLGRGGLRSGPAGNQEWRSAFALLQNGDVRGGISALSRIRKDWQQRPDHLVRAARHYEGAAQILIRHAVMTARKFISTLKCELSPLNKWVTAECPSRVDIAGGWSDTPPITYEHGGAVTNAAITIDGNKPIGAKVRRIPEPHLVLVLCGESGANTTLILRDLTQLADYSQPNTPGALLKAAFCCTEIVQYPSDVTLKDQLLNAYGGGFELHTWSNLPHGSGLGTSSILAGAVMAVLWRASGRMFDMQSLYHGVLHVEQMLTTGGGWQDQVGGLLPGIKMGHSAAQLPLKVEITRPKIDPEIVRRFGEHLVLVYTGKTRLARNLLQNVIRNWYARNPEIVATEDELVENAKDCAKAFENGDLQSVGGCLSNYWRLKKKMAPGSEPIAATRMISALQPYIWGISLAGAGGGGFMFVFTKKPNDIATVTDVLSSLPGSENVTIHQATVDNEGMTLTIEGQGRIPIPFQT